MLDGQDWVGHVDHQVPVPPARRLDVRRLRRGRAARHAQRDRPRPRDRRRGADPAAGPGGQNVLVVELGPARHRSRRRDPAHRRPLGQARLRLVLLRARRGPARVGLLRPARPQGPAPLHGQRADGVDRHQQQRRRTRSRTWSDGGRVWRFPDTPALSTYVVVVNAGPFHEIREQRGDHSLGLYCRQSLRRYLERDATELLRLTEQGLAFFGERFGMPFPQERYDQVFVPDMGGAMENWGCVTWSDSVLHRSPPTHRPAAVRGHGAAARDGAHVVRRPGDHALVGRPVAQRGVRVLGGDLGGGRRRRSTTDGWRDVSSPTRELQRLPRRTWGRPATRSAPRCRTWRTRSPTST